MLGHIARWSKAVAHCAKYLYLHAIGGDKPTIYEMGYQDGYQACMTYKKSKTWSCPTCHRINQPGDQRCRECKEKRVKANAS